MLLLRAQDSLSGNVFLFAARLAASRECDKGSPVAAVHQSSCTPCLLGNKLQGGKKNGSLNKKNKTHTHTHPITLMPHSRHGHRRHSHRHCVTLCPKTIAALRKCPEVGPEVTTNVETTAGPNDEFLLSAEQSVVMGQRQGGEFPPRFIAGVRPPSDAGATFPQVTKFVLGHRAILNSFDWSVKFAGNAVIPVNAPPISVSVWRAEDGVHFSRYADAPPMSTAGTAPNGILRGRGPGSSEVLEVGCAFVVLYEMPSAPPGFPFTDWFWGMSFRAVP